MNNIYKVIWSKAKNCYVVASEIARSHTKSASGSEKIGGVTRRSLLASLMALSLLCGGLGVAEATVHVNEGTGVTSEVYTTGETYSRELVDEKLKSKANANDVATNTANIANLEKNKLSKADASITYATKADVNTELTKKADRTYVDNALNDKADKADVYSKTDAENTFATKTELTAKADATALAGKANTDLSNLTEAGKTAIKTTMTDELAKKADNDTVTVLEGRVGVVEGKVAALETTVSDPSKGLVKKVTDLKTKTTQISFDPAKGTIVNGVDFMAQEVDAHGKGLTGVSTLHTTGDATVGGALTAAGVNAGTEAITGGSLSVTGAVTGSSVNAGSGEIKTDGVVNAGTLRTTSDATVGGAVNAGSLIVENASNLKGDVTMDNNLTVKGDTSLKKTDVDGALTAKGDVTLGTPNGTNTVTVNGTANFYAAAKMNNDLTVTGDTNLGNTTVTGNLNVTGTITTDNMIFGDKVNSNYTEIDHGKVTSKNHEVIGTGGAGQIISSSSTFNAKENEVGFANTATGGHSSHKQTSDVITDTVKNHNTGDQSFHKQTSDVIMDNVKDGKNSNNRTQTKTETKDIITDENGNSSTTSQTASQNKTYLKDKDGKNTNSTIDTAKGYDKTIKGEKGKTSTKQDELNITNTAQNGTITNDAQNIVNNASGNITNKANTMDTTVTGKATESYGELETTVNGKETHTVTGNQDIHVTGKQTNTVGGGQINNITGGQTNNILTGDQKTTVSDGSIINKAENGDISNTAKNVTNEGTVSVTNKVGTNEVKVSKDGVDINVDADKTIKESVGADTSRTMTDGNIIDKAGDMTVTTNKTTGTTFENGTRNDTTVINGGTIGTNKVNANETNTKKLTAGAAADADGGRLTVDANDGVKGSYKYGDYTSRSYILANTLQSGVDNDKEPIDADFVGSRTDHYMDGDKAKLDETVKDADGSNVTNKTSTSTKSTIKKGDITTAVKQEGDKIESSIIKDDNSQSNVTTSTVEATANAVTGKDANGNAQTSTVINNKDGLLITNTDNQTSFTTKDGISTDTAQNWTNIKGNEISTGKVEANYVKMDYADVMKDLGVHGNAKIDGKTTTGSLEVTGTSTLKGDVTMESNATVNGNFNVKGDTNLKNTKVDGTLNVTQKATFDDSVSIAKDLSVDGNATIKGDVTAKSYNVDGKTYIDANGIHANGQKITDVADGSISEGSKDAVNGGQLYTVKNDLEGKVNKVGANAAAMANLHPMEFDPDSKWNIAAAIGNYGSETAAALGAFYRPNDDVMVNLSTAFGTGENMVGGGVSVRLGKSGNKLSREESNALKDQVNDLTARMDALLSVLNPNMSKDFPDVPENHWAYEAVSRLAGNDIVQGYPDGEFHGERTMTRYEMAEIIYNALSRGAEAERELVEEFKPELQAMAASEKATAERAQG